MKISTLSLCAASLMGLLGCSQSTPTSANSTPVAPEGAALLDLVADAQDSQALSRKKKPTIVLVHLQGEVRHFGYDLTVKPAKGLPYRATVPGAQVWISEYPGTRSMNLRTDSLGRWELYVLKYAQDTLDFSFVFEKDFHSPAVEQAVFGAALPTGWDIARGKSNVIEVVSQDIEDLGMQLPDEVYFYYAKKQVEGQVAALSGTPYTLNNALVVTVGKSWASLYSDSLPHGDPGAHTVISPSNSSPFQGPIYFDERVQPNATYQATSKDGGVLYNNLPTGSISVTAVKAPYSYPTVRFVIEDEIKFYVASPPHSLEGSNSSLPGLN